MGLEAAEVERTAPAAARTLRLASLIFSRWCQVMLHFERAMYGDPEQDLNTLWWDLVERYQGVRRPEGRDAPRLCFEDSLRGGAGLLPQLHDG